MVVEEVQVLPVLMLQDILYFQKIYMLVMVVVDLFLQYKTVIFNIMQVEEVEVLFILHHLLPMVKVVLVEEEMVVYLQEIY